jgi:aminomethyltransferase
MTESNIKKTPLNEAHKKYGGKLVNFAGWELPVRYTELIDEHKTVRNAVGIFDVSHMGELWVSGKDALKYLQYITCNDVSKLYPGKAQYSALLNEQGGVIDDIIVYCIDDKNYLICVNASNSDKDYNWCKNQIKNFEITLENQSENYAQIAVQGPLAEKCLNKIFEGTVDFSAIKTFHFAQTDSLYGSIIAARTGYTGEDGFEIFIAPSQSEKLWNDLCSKGTEFGLKPCGLGARDTLRLEACYPLHGHELAEDISALESGLGWIVKFNKDNFIGKSALEKEKAQGSKRKLIGYFLEDKGIVREQTQLYCTNGTLVGYVTSGTLTPTVNRSLGMALVDKNLVRCGDVLEADVRGRKLKCQIMAMPFYKRGTL